MLDVQFEKGQVGVAVISLVFALRCDVVLERPRRLWVIAVESVQYRINVLWPVWRIVEGVDHLYDGCVRWRVGGARGSSLIIL